MRSFECFVWHQRKRHQIFMLERRTGDSRNNVGLSLSGIMRHVDLEIGCFVGDISLYFAFTTIVEALDTVVSLFRVGSSGGTSVFFCLTLFFFFFSDVGFGCGFPVHSFGFFMWLLVVLMVVDSGFVIGGGDETGFGCGFHVLCVESRG